MTYNLYECYYCDKDFMTEQDMFTEYCPYCGMTDLEFLEVLDLQGENK